jgi:DNA-binding GntR family transcriptional regulator
MRAMMYEATALSRAHGSNPMRASDPARSRPDFARIRGSVPLAIADQIEEAIRDGRLCTGDRLPTQRGLADDLGFHLNTINAAFREAARRGLIESRTRRGSFVCVALCPA